MTPFPSPRGLVLPHVQKWKDVHPHAVVATLVDRVRREERSSLDVSLAAVRLVPTPVGEGVHLVAAGQSFELEEGGLRALLGHCTAAFPRLTPAALRMRPDVLARVWETGIADHAEELPPDVRLRLRGGAVFGAMPTTAPMYGLDDILEDLEEARPARWSGPCSAVYRADESDCHISLSQALGSDRADAWLRVEISDGFPCSVKVTWGRGPRALGDPAPDVERRRRGRQDGSMSTGMYVELFRRKFAGCA